MLKIWHCICLLICGYNLINLINDRYDVMFVKENELVDSNFNERYKFLYCVDLKKIFARRRFIRLKNTRFTIEKLSDLIFNEMNRTLSIKKDGHRLRRIILQFQTDKEYVFFNYQICLITPNIVLYKYLIKNFFMSTCYMVLLRPFTLLRDCVTQSFRELKVKNLGHPYSNCKSESNDNRQYSRFLCINSCLKRLSSNSLAYFYSANETVLANFDKIGDNNFSLEYEEFCLKECKYIDCELVILQKYQSVESKLIIAKPLIESREFFFGFIGILCLFTGTNLTRVILLLINLFLLKRSILKSYSELIYTKLRKIILIASFLLTICIFFQQVAKFYHDLKFPVEKEIIDFAISVQSFKLVICVKVDRVKPLNISDNTDFNLDFVDDEGLYTWNEVEQATNDILFDHLEEIYIDYGSRKLKVDYEVSPEVLISYDTKYRRCFVIKLNFEQKKIQNLIMIQKLVIVFKTSDFVLFLMPENEIFSNSAFHFSSRGNIVKEKIERSGSLRNKKCRNYKSGKDNCYNYYHCKAKCIVEEYFEKHNKIPLNTVIHKDFNFNKSALFSYKTDLRIRNQCERRYQLNECFSTKFAIGEDIQADDVQRIETPKIGWNSFNI